MRNLSLVGKITVFKSLAFSKIVFLAFLTLLLNNIIKELKHVQSFYGLTKTLKLNLTLSVDIVHKINALKCSWIQKLYNDNFDEWRIIPLRYVK